MIVRTSLAVGLVVVLTGSGFAQIGPVNPAVVGNPSYTGYGAAPPAFIPGSLGNPSYTGYDRSLRSPSGFNPSYTGIDQRPSSNGDAIYGSNGYTNSQSPLSVYRYAGDGRSSLSPLPSGRTDGPQDVVAPQVRGFETPRDRYPKPVTLQVHVPVAAEVFVQGDRTRSGGATRTFISPNLEPLQSYTYEIRARWIEEGKTVEQTRRVPVRAGDRVEVDFSKAER